MLILDFVLFNFLLKIGLIFGQYTFLDEMKV